LRTRNGDHEVDFVVERGRDVVAIEVKLKPLVEEADVRHLTWLAGHLGPRLKAAIVLTTGPNAYRRPADGILVVPASLLGP
jgi:predicted AAA+ superfamily ATPase